VIHESIHVPARSWVITRLLLVGIIGMLPCILNQAANASIAGTAVRYQVIASSAAPANLLTDQTFTVSGRVAPVAPNSPVVLERKLGKRWSPISSFRLSSTSTFLFHEEESRPGHYVFRVVKSASSGASIAISRVFGQLVQVWSYLKNWQPINGSVATDQAELSGKKYFQNVDFYNYRDFAGVTAVSYNLAKHCTELQATLGMDDTNPVPTDTAEFVVQNDGTTSFDQMIRFGEALPIVVSVTGVLRLSLNATFNATAYSAQLDLANAQLLCSFAPASNGV